ncbi:MAG: hypothetical protein H6738_03590 [Alphaproteobacteria bacterium]|nr:hypothetical protein [Alphaproteobacteria bacterium]MCB9695851.1 hypothetical protein [Alphaproteobacteria bacterium]
MAAVFAVAFVDVLLEAPEPVTSTTVGLTEVVVLVLVELAMYVLWRDLCAEELTQGPP